MAHIVSTGSVSNGTTTSHSTSAVDTTGANLIVVTVSTFANGSSGPTMTDNKGNTYLVAAAQLGGLDADAAVTTYYVSAPSVGTNHTFTFGVSAADFLGLAVSAFSGMETTGALDQVLRTAESGVTTSHTTGNTAALAQADEVVIGSLAIGSLSTLSIGAGYTDGFTVAADADSMGVSQEYKTVSSTAAVAATWTTGTSNRLPLIVTTWKIAAASGVTGTSNVTTAGVSGSATSLLTQVGVPVSDSTVGSWLSTGANLFSTIDEYPANDADYIYTETLSSSCRVKLTGLTDPNSSTGHVLQYRLRGNGAATVTVKLYTGGTTTVGTGTLVRTWNHAAISATLQDFEQTLSGAEADTISDYANLYLEFSAT